MTRRLPLIISALVLLTRAAEAHTGIGATSGFQHGFGHPFSGLDHTLALAAVGLYATILGGRALYVVPTAFLAMMAGGGALATGGIDVPFAEAGIGVSVLVLGAAVALRFGLPTLFAALLVGTFAIFHGHAHGAEMPVDASGLGYALGFLLATALLHAIGIGIGVSNRLLTESSARRLTRAGGAALALAGVGLVLNLA